MKKEKTVSLCMIVKNEEKYLPTCLNSVKELVDEMIIIDTGSKDNTVNIAKDFGAKIHYYEWDNNFSNARNYSLQFATKEWILLMDADDEFNKDDSDKFIRLINNSTKDGHYFKTLSYAGEYKGDNIVYNLNLRLLRNTKKYSYIGAIHEQITCNESPIDYSNFSPEEIRIFHYGYLNNVALEKNKRQRNISIINEELKQDQSNPFHIFNLGNEYFALGEKEKALELYNSAYKNLDFNIGFSSKLVFKRIMCFYELGQFGDALHAIGEGLNIYPKFTDLEFNRGCIHLKNKRYTLALDSFNKCLELGPSPTGLEFLDGCGTYRPNEALGKLYYELNDYQKAFIYYQNALKDNSNSPRLIYKIGNILNKIYEDKKFVSYKLSQYFNINHLPNLLLLSDILLFEGLYHSALGYLEKAKDLDENNIQIKYLTAQAFFYTKNYSEAQNLFEQLPVNSLEYQESIKYLFICSLINNQKNIDLLFNNIESNFDQLIIKVYRQLLSIYLGNNETLFSEVDNYEKITELVMTILNEPLKIHEFILFEKLINILNKIDSNKVLLKLAKIYSDNNFKQIAAKEVLRSIKELNTIDPEGVKILYEEFCF
ncbi:MAG: glycosyltransferase [Eubacteriales bacterium]